MQNKIQNSRKEKIKLKTCLIVVEHRKFSDRTEFKQHQQLQEKQQKKIRNSLGRLHSNLDNENENREDTFR